MALAELVDNPILFVHVSAADAATAIRNAQTRHVRSIFISHMPIWKNFMIQIASKIANMFAHLLLDPMDKTTRLFGGEMSS
jgi:hypothetical protein